MFRKRYHLFSTMRFTSCMRYIIFMLMFDRHSLSRLRNFALRKSAYQSSTLNYRNFNWTADKAVDGNIEGRPPGISRACSETDIRMGNHTWEVDIGFMFIVNHVVIYERSDGQDQLSGFQVIIGNHSNPWRANMALEKKYSSRYKYILYADNTVARFVSVIRTNKETMTLCEVEVYGECLDGMYSEFCNHTCGQCSNGEPCNKDTRECPSGCEPGWTGLLCNKGLQNFALRKSAYQSSTLNDRDFNWTADKAVDGKSAYQSTTLNFRDFNWTADKAVDGNIDGRYPGSSRTCSKTDVRMGNHTWEVDIGYMFIVNHVVIYERSDGLDQLSGFQVIIGNHSNPWRANTALQRNYSTLYKYIFYADDTMARFVSVIRENKETMTLCEVEVYGQCLDGMYSEFCNHSCGRCSNREPCNKDTGECLRGCEPGWTGRLCKIECARGTYGSGCTYTCGQCLNGNETCSATDGRCSMGCREGWQGETCKTNSSAKLAQTLSTEDMTVIGGSVVGVCVGALIISIIIIAVLNQRRNMDTGDPEMEMNETGVSREQTIGDSADTKIMSPSDYNVASLCIPTTTASRDDSEYEAAQITEAEYEKLQDRGRIESSLYSRINGTETENTNYYDEVGLHIGQE